MVNKFPEIKYNYLVNKDGQFINYFDQAIQKHNNRLNSIHELNLLSDIAHKYCHGRIHMDDVIRLEEGNYRAE
jgi:predicted nucleic acid-binding OB-fold protein